MLVGYEKLRVPDIGKEKDFFMEVNWNKDPRIQNCAVVRVTFPNGDTMHVRRDHLHALFFALGTPEEQQKLIPQSITRVREIEGHFKVKANKNIRKGEEVIFPYKIAVPEPEEMVMQDLKRKMEGGVKSTYFG